ncbi:MAG TPA: hypothetical protein VJG32_19165 [Anaerolineae bacterium]|nr:hypothetical protein [Anaerolineae bacterium]
MTSDNWTWAGLTHDQLDLLAEAERTLGPDFLLAYRHDAQAIDSTPGAVRGGLRVATLNESQLDCLRGLETRLQAIVVAYQGGRA